MFRIKFIKLFSLVLALLLLAPVVFASEPQSTESETGEPQDIIDLEQIETEQTAYETAQVERGSLTGGNDVMTSKYYPLTHHVHFELDSAKFVEYTVENGDTVKKGDVLVRFTVSRSDADLTRLELDLQRAEEQMDEGIRTREEDIKKKRAELKAASDTDEKELLQLSLKKMEAELKQYEYRQKHSVAQKREAYNEEYTLRTTTELVSPADGVVIDLTYKSTNDLLYRNEKLMTIYSEDPMQLLITERMDLRYNMPIEVKLGNKEDSPILTGRIVAADDAVPAAERTGYALIELDPYDKEKYTMKSDTVKATVIIYKYEDALLVPADAITYDGEECYVTKLIDGVQQECLVKVSAIGIEQAVITSGVEEGETLVWD